MKDNRHEQGAREIAIHMRLVDTTTLGGPSDGSQSDIQRRRHQRHACDWPARYSVDAKHYQDIRVINVSISGLGLSSTLPGEVGDTIFLSLKDIGEFRSRIAWKSPSAAGVEIIDSDAYWSEKQVQELGDLLISLDTENWQATRRIAGQGQSADGAPAAIRDFAELSVAELELLVAQTAAMLDETKKRRRMELKAQIEAALAQEGFSIADVMGPEQNR